MLSAVPVMARNWDEVDSASEVSDCQKSLRLLKALSEQRDKVAQAVIGSMYSHGEGVLKDESKIVHRYRKAMESFDTAVTASSTLETSLQTICPGSLMLEMNSHESRVWG